MLPDSPSDTLIIKAHLLCEYYVNQLLILRGLCSFKEVDSLKFWEKIKKAFENGKPNEKLAFNYLNQLNKLRNRVGHELEYSLSESDVDSLGYVAGKDYILEKYKSDTNERRLRAVLERIVLCIAFIAINAIRDEIAKNESAEK